MAELLLWEGQAAALTLTALAAGALLRRRERRLVMPLWWVWLLRLLCPLSLPLLTLPNPPRRPYPPPGYPLRRRSEGPCR